MTRWSPQLFSRQAPAGYPSDVLTHAIAVADAIVAVNPKLPPLFSLRHIAYQTNADYHFLRAVVTRAQPEPYRTFRLRKRPAHSGEVRYRVIAVPDPTLLRVQSWITQRILAEVSPHSASVAYSKGNRLMDAARPHCGSRWLIKLDVRNFFESINEVAVYRVFRSLGYQPLVALELSRICTRMGNPTGYRQRNRWLLGRLRTSIDQYRQYRMGHLPQGAPTSPMLANLAVRAFDAHVTKIAGDYGMIYTRYADDLSLSTVSENFDRAKCAKVIGEVYSAMGKAGLSPNITKTRIASPGARKIVLGLLVDGAEPRLPRDFRATFRRHIYYLSKSPTGPAEHAEARGFASIRGMKNHVYGLATFARQIEPVFGDECLARLNKVVWPI
jgi:RNA-directed DNA polymerase